MSFNVLISDPLSEEGVHPLKEADNLNITKKTDLTKDELLKEIGNYDALLVRSQTQVTREAIEQAHNLKVLVRSRSQMTREGKRRAHNSKVIRRARCRAANSAPDPATETGASVVNATSGNSNAPAAHTISMSISPAGNRPRPYLSIQHKKR